jgi:hypothetical protein
MNEYLAAIAGNNRALKSVPCTLWKDGEFFREAVIRNGEALDWVDEKLLSPELCAAAVAQNGMALEYVPRPWRSAKNAEGVSLCLAAVRQNGMALQFVPEMLLSKEIVCTAVSNCPAALAFVPDEWREEAKAALMHKS